MEILKPRVESVTDLLVKVPLTRADKEVQGTLRFCITKYSESSFHLGFDLFRASSIYKLLKTTFKFPSFFYDISRQ